MWQAKSTPKLWYATAEEFKQVCQDAQRQAKYEWDQEFAADIELRRQKHGMEMPFSQRQLTQLCRIADHIPPLRRSS